MAFNWGKLKFWAGRPRHVPERATDVYPRLIGLGFFPGTKSDLPVIKPLPANLRYFSRTPHARRAINAIKNPVAMLDWEVVPKDEKPMEGELKRQCEIVTTCLRNPNQEDSFMTWSEQIIEDYLAVGAGASEMQLGGRDDRPLWMFPVDGISIQIFPGWSGERNESRYIQTIGFGNVSMLEGTQLTNEELMYIRPNPSTSTPYGYGPLEIAFTTISRKLGVSEYAGNLTANAIPENLISVMGYDDNQIKVFRGYWRNEIEGQGNAPIIGVKDKDAVKVHPLRGGTDEALYLQYQEFLIREIAAAFDLSPQNLGVEQKINRSTSETAEDRDWDQAIVPMAKRMASHINRDAIQGRLGFSQIEFRYVGLDREDEKDNADIFDVYYEDNVITANEQRKKLGMEPTDSPWGDMMYADVQIAIAAAKGESAQPADKTKKLKSKPKVK